MRDELDRIFRAGVAACSPERVLPAHLSGLGSAPRTIVLAIGKAAVGMAQVAEARLESEVEGLAVAPHGTAGALRRIELLHAGHPVPDEASVAAARRLIEAAGRAREGELVLVLLSGGASALACLPGEGLSLADKQRLTNDLLRSGASITEINCVRRHLSGIKGGRLGLAAAPARLVTLAISDVVGDRPEDIGSGPTVADPTTEGEARAVLARYGIDPPRVGWSESAKRVDGDYRIVASARHAIEAAAAEAARLGYRPLLLGECTGEAREVAARHAALAMSAAPGTALISGGELTVTLRGRGRGGPNQEYALAAALALPGHAGIAGLAADTDGVDGNSHAAGAFFDGATVDNPAEAARALEAHDSGGYLEARRALLVTGPTGTNVNDLRVLLTHP